jgi:hypothetical protein
MEVKEGILLDRDGTPIAQSPHERVQTSFTLARTAVPIAFALIVAVPLFIFAGVAIAGAILFFMILFAVLGLIRRIVK